MRVMLLVGAAVLAGALGLIKLWSASLHVDGPYDSDGQNTRDR